MSKVQSKNAILYDIGNDAGPLRDAIVDAIGEGTTTDSGLFAASDKTKLDGIAAGATANATDASLRDRTTHTGEQAIETITGLATALAGKATPTDVAAALAGLVDSSPATLDTLNELAAALGDDPDFATTVSTALGNRLRVDAAQGLTTPQQAQGRGNLGLGSAALAASGDFATAAQGAKTDQLPVALAANGLLASAADGLSSAWLTYPEARKALDLAFVENYSMPTALNRQPVYVALDGTDDTDGNMYHGFDPEYPFLTNDAALLHAQKHLRFTGRLKGLDMKFGPGRHGGFNLGSNLLQGQEKFPFSVGVSSIDPTDWAIFDGITCGTWGNNDVYVSNVDAAYFSCTRLSSMCINDVGYRPMRDEFNNPVYISYGMFSSLGSFVHAFGDHEIKEPITNASAFMYGAHRGTIALENGDSPIFFPQFNLIGAAGITSPYKYRAVIGSYMYIPSNAWPMLTFASNFFCDATSFSTQTHSGQDVNLNAASGGPCVLDGGNTSAGWRLYADGFIEQWGTETLSALAPGRTNVAASITLPKELISASYMVEGGTNNMDVRVGLHGTPLTTGFSLGAYNHNATAQSATARWRVSGYIM